MKPLPITLTLYGSDGRRKYLTASERSQFIATARRHPRRDVRTFCLFVAYSGCRISEGLAMTAGSIDRIQRLAAIISLKKRGRMHVREVPLPDEVVSLIEELHDLADVAAGKRLWSWSRGRAWALIKQVMDQAGIVAGPHRTPKGLRHGFGINAVRCGVPLNLLQRWLGHASLATTAIYANALGEEERQIASKMW